MMKVASTIINDFIAQIKKSEIFSSSCDAIRAFESGTLPVPIKKIYYSFACEENSLTFTTDSAGTKKETNSITVRMNAFIPLKSSIAISYSLTENILLLLISGNKNITGVKIGTPEYDSDVDAYRITSRIYLNYTQ